MSTLRALAEMAEASGGGIIDPPRTVGECPDWEDNRVLDLASAMGAFLVVSADTDLAYGQCRTELNRAGLRS
jgi:predicted nucleic acid-binding protein